MPYLLPNITFAGRYTLLEKLGIGGYSEVWKATDNMAGEMLVALKIFAPDKGLDKNGIQVFSKEYGLVFNLNHQYLLKPSHYDIWEGSPYLVMPYCKNGSLYNKIGEMNETEVLSFIQQAADALNYLHSQPTPIIHQDIKPDNFLINDNGNYLLSDFGISSRLRRTLTRSIGNIGSSGTMAYLPPERFSEDKQILPAGDIFALGVTIYELLTGDLPFDDQGGLRLRNGAGIPNLPSHFSFGINDIVRSCLDIKPALRPDAEALKLKAANFANSLNKVAPASSKPKLIPEDRRTVPIPIYISPKPDELQNSKPSSHIRKISIFAVIIAIAILIFLMYVNFNDGHRNEFSLIDSTANISQINAAIDTVLAEVPSVSNKEEAIVADSSAFISYYAEPEMVYVAGGTFQMGSLHGEEDEMPIHSVTLKSFKMSKNEITQKQWISCMGNNPSYFKGDNLPVENVSWEEVQLFIYEINRQTDKNYRLPTEAEWEYAAGGGSNSRSSYSGTSSKSSLGKYAWYNENSKGHTHVVGLLQPNILGLYDMNGNVWEWCNDWYTYYRKDIQVNPKGPVSGSNRIIRGGSWDYDFSECRVTFRNYDSPRKRSKNIGFRLVLQD